MFLVNQWGQLKTPAELIGIAVHASNKEECTKHINNFFDNPDRSLWEQQQKAFRKFCPPNDSASLRATRRILSLVEPDIAKQHDLPPIHSVWTPVTGENRIFLKQGQNSESREILHLQLKRIKAYGMPISSVLLRELHQVSGAEIFVATGTFSEDIASQAADIFKEVHTVELAADLYQPSAMPDIARHKNIHIYHSANVLKVILPNLRGKILFWLGTNETAGITFKNRTNTPVIEELRVIAESGIKDSFILINNMRYFQPIVSDKPPWYGRESRKYPDVQQAIDAILGIDRTYQFSILGDIAIAYPAGSPVTVSPTVRACTLSRMFNGNNSDIISVFEAESMIAFGLPKSEKEAVQALHKDYYDPYEEPGVGGHYRFWYALTLFGEKRYAEAKNEFLKAINLNCNHWRVVWFLTESAHRSGDTGLAKQAVKNSSLEKPVIAGYHRFWHGLTLFGEQRHAEAKQEFIRAMQLKCNHWRAAWFLAESAHHSGDIAMAKEAAQALLKAVPNFQPAKKLLERIESN